jgi:hypothetical protein
MEESMSEDPNVKIYINHKIELNPRSWEFTVSGPEFDDLKYKMSFKSYQAAREEIEKRVSETNKMAAKNISFSLSVLDANGSNVVVSRINRTTSELSGLTTKQFYPNVSWVREALQKRKALASELKNIENALRPVEMINTLGWGGRIEADSYGRVVEKLNAEFTEKTKIANEAATPKEAVSS